MLKAKLTKPAFPGSTVDKRMDGPHTFVEMTVVTKVRRNVAVATGTGQSFGKMVDEMVNDALENGDSVHSFTINILSDDWDLMAHAYDQQNETQVVD